MAEPCNGADLFLVCTHVEGRDPDPALGPTDVHSVPTSRPELLLGHLTVNTVDSKVTLNLSRDMSWFSIYV